VKQYSDPVPLFQRYGAEDQLKAMYDPVVQLKSGGYLVINPTEALVSIDINSGRSTKEHNIEQTALHTNLEAAREIARQLRLRDMAGLIVIDFIDQEHHSNTRKVEKAMKEALKNDRARIQVGRISSFGLMEMSRQRLRTGVLEATTRDCPHCDGTGLVRTASSAGLSALRLIEDEAAKGKGSTIRLAASTEAAVYLLNEKRADLMEIEQRYRVTVEVVPEGEDEGAKMTVSSHGPKPKDAPRFEPIVDDDGEDDVFDETDEDDGDDDRPRKKRRRRRGGRGRSKNRQRDDEGDQDDADDLADDIEGDEGDDEESGDDKPKKRRRRGGRRRGGRGRGKSSDEITSQDAEKLEEVSEAVVEDMAVVAGPEDSPETAEAVADADETDGKPKPRKRAPRKKKADTAAKAKADETASAEGEETEKPKPKKRAPRKKKVEVEPESVTEATDEAKAEDEVKPAPKKRAPRKKKSVAESPAQTSSEPAPQPEPEPEPAPQPDAAAAEPVAEESPEPSKPAKPKRGWWQRTFGDE